MVYRWRLYRDICYRLYVEENKSLDEVIQYMREEHNFTPRYVGSELFWLFSLVVSVL
jgi:hypothetical protein